jgi:predicted RNA binding protein YcfA (HicA-like mRNA interferase family)
VFNIRGRKSPASLKWQEVVRIVEKLGAVHERDSGDHKQYVRRSKKGLHTITIPTYDDISGKLLDSIIRQTGVKKKDFWNAYYSI